MRKIFRGQDFNISTILCAVIRLSNHIVLSCSKIPIFDLEKRRDQT
ncbi:MAG: hypothetical protein MRERC_17c001 [Mycoplasmataceae bacterium RC_NB112A]|nr:MAG: hypothetical protein MRERC_17c001 [Mycoplasmataceae bacterium RC_NB112A]